MEPSCKCNHQQSLPENEVMKLPPGYRFHPRDDELILHYLQKQIDGHPLPIPIPQICLATTNPHTLSERYSKIGDDYWYFLTSRDRKYPNGTRPNRGAESGYWKATGSDKRVMMGRKVIGYKKTLVFYQGKPQSGNKTAWIMQEYRLNQLPRQKQTPTDMRLDDCVLCRIHKKEPKVNSKTEDDLDDGSDSNDGDDKMNAYDANINSSPNYALDQVSADHLTDQVSGGSENQNHNSFCYDDIDINIEDHHQNYDDINIQNIFGVLGEGEQSMEDILTPVPAPSMQDILTPVPVEPQQPQPFGLGGFDTCVSSASASSSHQNSCPMLTNFSVSASSSQNNSNSSASSTSASSSQMFTNFYDPLYKGPTF